MTFVVTEMAVEAAQKAAMTAVWPGPEHGESYIYPMRRALAAALPHLAQQVDSEEQVLANEILAELARARSKFPGKNVTFAALIEEVGELATATFEEGRARVHKEAVQVAVMAMRMVLDGDHTFDDWRREKGLDALATPFDPLGEDGNG